VVERGEQVVHASGESGPDAGHFERTLAAGGGEPVILAGMA
jgi:hypothetical protein